MLFDALCISLPLFAHCSPFRDLSRITRALQAGKFPTLVQHSDNLETKVTEVRSQVPPAGFRDVCLLESPLSISVGLRPTGLGGLLTYTFHILSPILKIS